MTVARWYNLALIMGSQDKNLFEVLDKYVPSRHISLQDALRRTALIKALFGADCKIESKSAFGVIVINRRNKVPVQTGGKKTWVCENDPKLADVLDAYNVRDLKLVGELFGDVKLSVYLHSDDAMKAYQKIARAEGNGRAVRV
jgi:hypothetical protein